MGQKRQDSKEIRMQKRWLYENYYRNQIPGKIEKLESHVYSISSEIRRCSKLSASLAARFSNTFGGDRLYDEGPEGVDWSIETLSREGWLYQAGQYVYANIICRINCASSAEMDVLNAGMVLEDQSFLTFLDRLM